MTTRLPPAPSYLPFEQNPRPTHALKAIAKDFTNPKYIGPGMWVAIHTLAKGATTYEKKKAFVDYMNGLRLSFPCSVCRKHLNTYLDTHSFDSYWKKIDPTTGEDVGLFVFSVEFHNAVNIRLGKPVMDIETAKALYSPDNDVCALDCQDAH
jgi:hypothetical protein